MKLHIGNLAKTVDDEQLRAMAVLYGTVVSATVVGDPAGASRGFGFVEYGSADEANAAIAGMNGSEVSGQPLKVSEARPRKNVQLQA